MLDLTWLKTETTDKFDVGYAKLLKNRANLQKNLKSVSIFCKILQCMIIWREEIKMSHNDHIGTANDRRKVNNINVKNRRKQHLAVLDFLKKQEEAEKSAK